MEITKIHFQRKKYQLKSLIHIIISALFAFYIKITLDNYGSLTRPMTYITISYFWKCVYFHKHFPWQINPANDIAVGLIRHRLKMMLVYTQLLFIY